MTDLAFDGQVAIVTGAGRGLGRAHALELAGRGVRVVVNDLAPADGPAPADEVVDEMRAAGGEAVADGSNIADPDGASGLVARAVDAFGRLDIVVNNAGILRDRSFAKLSLEDFDAVIAVHLRGSFLVIQAAWPHLLESDHPAVVNTTSVAGYLGNFGQANYGAAKAGLIGLTNVLAIEGARAGIRVNAIAPGARTRMTEDLLGDLADHLDPALVAAVVAFLVHPDCDATGQVFSTAGGRVSRLVVGQTQGLFDADLTAEAVRDGWSTVQDETDLATPATFAEELELLVRHLPVAANG